MDVDVCVHPLPSRCSEPVTVPRNAAGAQTRVPKHLSSPKETGPQRDGKRSLNILYQKVKGHSKNDRAKSRGTGASLKGPTGQIWDDLNIKVKSDRSLT